VTTFGEYLDVKRKEFNERKREEQVEGLLTYQFEALIMPKELGNIKGIMENPILKIELTKTNALK
jgi:hypothetical protein